MSVAHVPRMCLACLIFSCRTLLHVRQFSCRTMLYALHPIPYILYPTLYTILCVPAVQVRDLTGDGHVTKRRVRDGVGEFPVDCPIEDACVKVHYRSDPRLRAGTVLLERIPV